MEGSEAVISKDKYSAVIQAIFLSRERKGSVYSPTTANAVAGKGIEGDRYFDDGNRKSEDYQITFIESEKIDLYNASHPGTMEYWQPRRNILTKGVSLDDLIGIPFQIGEARFERLEACEPCELFRARTSQEAFNWFRGKGGLRARILQSGRIWVGAAIQWKDSARDGGMGQSRR